ncbi:MAG TPA: hypothetical protein VF006_33985 [Longimicrobium sp.]
MRDLENRPLTPPIEVRGVVCGRLVFAGFGAWRIVFGIFGIDGGRGSARACAPPVFFLPAPELRPRHRRRWADGWNVLTWAKGEAILLADFAMVRAAPAARCR